jgi:hypothetical protein
MPKQKKGKRKEDLKVAIVPYEKEVKDRIYSNYVVIRHTPYDFSLEFCEIPPATEEESKELERTKQVKAYVRAKIALPVKIIPSLILALDDNYKKYEKKFEKK